MERARGCNWERGRRTGLASVKEMGLVRRAVVVRRRRECMMGFWGSVEMISFRIKEMTGLQQFRTLQENKQLMET